MKILPLQDSLPHLFSFVQQEDGSVGDFIAQDRPTRNLFLPLSMEASEELDALHIIVHGLESDESQVDKWLYVWG